MVNDEVVAMLVAHVDDIKIGAATKEITGSIVADQNKIFPTKHLGEVTWYMGSDSKRDRKKGTLEIVQTQAISKMLLSNVSVSPLHGRCTSGTRVTRKLWWTRISTKWWQV